MTEIQKTFNEPSKFIQLVMGTDAKGAAFYALDEMGTAWKYEEEGVHHRTFEPTDAGWRPLSMVRYEKLPSTRELKEFFQAFNKPKEKDGQ